jgi:hypothetical protein
MTNRKFYVLVGRLKGEGKADDDDDDGGGGGGDGGDVFWAVIGCTLY